MSFQRWALHGEKLGPLVAVRYKGFVFADPHNMSTITPKAAPPLTVPKDIKRMYDGK